MRARERRKLLEVGDRAEERLNEEKDEQSESESFCENSSGESTRMGSRKRTMRISCDPLTIAL